MGGKPRAGLSIIFQNEKRIFMTKPGIYEHFKGNRYELVAIANHSETLEKMAVYRALYGNGELWVRPLTMWEETVIVNGEEKPRFRFIEASQNSEADVK